MYNFRSSSSLKNSTKAEANSKGASAFAFILWFSSWKNVILERKTTTKSNFPTKHLALSRKRRTFALAIEKQENLQNRRRTLSSAFPLSADPNKKMRCMNGEVAELVDALL